MTEQPGWVPTRSGAVFAALHHPTGTGTDAAASRAAVVLVPPFGWEAMSSARQLRGWARALADAGHTAVRFHLPGTGDSPGAAAHQDLVGWAGALADVVAHTRAASPGDRVAVVALGLGGLSALQAVDDGCQIDDLVLWSTPGRGRLLLRELKAFAALVGEPGNGPAPATTTATAGREADATTDAPDGGLLWVHGYPLTAAAQQQLLALDAATLRLERLERALVLGRGSLPHDARLVTALRDQGVAATGGPGPGYDELTLEPRLSQQPSETFALVQEWLRARSAAPAAGAAAAPTGQAGARETPWPVADVDTRPLEVGPVRGVLSCAGSPVLTAVFLGAGATPRSGPNRLWTEAAERWREWGITSLRVDLPGIGDADGPDTWATGPEGFYLEEHRPHVQAVLDEVVRLGLPERLLLIGLCSGGFWAAQAALTDDRVVGVVALNTLSLVWPPPLTPLGPRERLRHLTRGATWRPLVTDRAARQDALGRARRSMRLRADRLLGAPTEGSRRAPATTTQVLHALEARGVQVTVGASPGEACLPELLGLPAGSTTVVRQLAGPAGAHTLSTAGLRAQAEELLDEAARAALSAQERVER